MFDHIIKWAIKARFLVALILLSILALAVMSLNKLNLDAFPDVTNVQVVINTEAPGLAAEEVEQLITFPIESVMYAMPDVEQVRSISKTGLSGITVVFKDDVDIYFARQLVFQRLQMAKSKIPDNIGIPEIGPNTSGLGQIYQYLLVADENSDYDTLALRSLNDWVLTLLLMPVDGITDVLSFGGHVRQYQVNLNPNRLLSYQLSHQQVIDALHNNNINHGGWYMNRGQEQLVIRGTGWLSHSQQGLEQIRQIPLKTNGSAVVTIGDVASIEFGSEIRQGAVTMSERTKQGQIHQRGEVVAGIVLKRLGANTKTTIDGIKKRLTIIEQALPQGVSFKPYYDQSDLIDKAVTTVSKALLLAFVFIIAVLLLFLLNIRATLLVLISIPIAITMALLVMSLTGMSANLMSLGGLAVAIGLLVDGSVVMVEAIYKQLQQNNVKIEDAIFTAASSVARPIFFASSIILVVFLPLFSFEGVEAKLFQPMAISIMLALVTAIIVAIVVVPALATIVYKNGIGVRTNNLVGKLELSYQKLLTTLFNYKKAISFILLLLAASALYLTSKLGTEFVPELEEGTINLRVTLAPSASLETTLAVAPKLEKVLLSFPEVTYALSRIGRPEIGGDPEPVNNIEIYLGLKPINQWQSANNRQQLQALMQQQLDQFPGLMFNFSQPIATRVDELLSGVKAQLAIKLFGPDLKVLANKGAQIEHVVKQVAGTADVAMEQISGEAQLIISPKRKQLSRYGLSVSDVMAVVKTGLGGSSAGQVINGNERYDIYVRYQNEFRDHLSAISDIRLQSPQGAWLKLADVANVRYEFGPPQIRRDNVQRRVVIQANVVGRDMGSVVNDIYQQIETQVSLPSGYTTQIGGQFESQLRAQQRLQLVVPLSLLLITLLLMVSFNSLAQTLLIMINIPLAFVGGVLALYFSGHYLSVPSAIGFITLFGIAVLNGVVMVESINRQQGDLVTKAKQGASKRLRPVLMTALTSALGLLPMLMATGVGAEIQKPLATVIVGGLVSATLLTLIVLPLYYPSFMKFSRHKQ